MTLANRIKNGLLIAALCIVSGFTMLGASGNYTTTKQFTLTVAPALTISNVSPLPGAVVGQPYSVTFVGAGGIPPYSWKLDATSAALPPGLSLTAAGVLAGNPTTAGTYGFTIDLVDGDGNVQKVSINVAMPKK